jgi:hypothetical protein
MNDFEKELVNDTVPKEPDKVAIEDQKDTPNIEVSFGKGTSKKVLLCTQGVTLKNLYEMSK